VGNDHWLICVEHRKKWCIGTDLFSSSMNQSKEEQRAVCDKIGFDNYEIVHDDAVFYEEEVSPMRESASESDIAMRLRDTHNREAAAKPSFKDELEHVGGKRIE
jgi:hypothetical protein